MIGTKRQFIYKDFNLGTTLGGEKNWKGGRLFDIKHEIRLMPGFDLVRFPYIIGLGMDDSRLILANVVSRQSMSIVYITKNTDYD